MNEITEQVKTIIRNHNSGKTSYGEYVAQMKKAGLRTLEERDEAWEAVIGDED